MQGGVQSVMQFLRSRTAASVTKPNETFATAPDAVNYDFEQPKDPQFAVKNVDRIPGPGTPAVGVRPAKNAPKYAPAKSMETLSSGATMHLVSLYCLHLLCPQPGHSLSPRPSPKRLLASLSSPLLDTTPGVWVGPSILIQNKLTILTHAARDTPDSPTGPRIAGSQPADVRKSVSRPSSHGANGARRLSSAKR